MALTLTKVGRGSVFGDRRVRTFDITFDSSYPTGGEAFTLASIGLKTVEQVILTQKAPVTGTSLQFGYNWLDATPKLQAYWVDTSVDGAALAEVVSTTDLSTYTVRATFIGV